MKTNRIEIQPTIRDQTDGSKRVEINAEIPENIDPTKISVNQYWFPPFFNVHLIKSSSAEENFKVKGSIKRN